MHVSEMKVHAPNVEQPKAVQVVLLEAAIAAVARWERRFDEQHEKTRKCQREITKLRRELKHALAANAAKD
jgi:hypothetical protein